MITDTADSSESRPLPANALANAVAGERRPIRLSADAENLYHPDPSAEDRFEQFRRLRRTATLGIT
jgi:hypothetical protein